LEVSPKITTFALPKRKDIMKTLATDYIGKADTTVDTVQLENGNIVYLYNKDGDTSLLPNLESLYNFLNGDTSVRMACIPTSEADEIIEGFEKLFSE